MARSIKKKIQKNALHHYDVAIMIFITIVSAVAVFIFLPTTPHTRVARGKTGSSTQQVALKNIRPPDKNSFYTPILMYHHINPFFKSNPYNVTPKIFAEQMDWLEANNYNVITYDEFYHALTNGLPLPTNPVVITFDDGFRDQYEYALPILKSHNFTAMFFIYTNLTKAADGMNWEMLNELVASGMEIGDHTASHAFLPALSGERLEYEIAESRAILEDHLGIPIQYFAYPGGSYTPATIEALQKDVYLSAVTVHHSVFHEYGSSPFEVRRIHIDNDMQSFVRFIQDIGM